MLTWALHFNLIKKCLYFITRPRLLSGIERSVDKLRTQSDNEFQYRYRDQKHSTNFLTRSFPKSNENVISVVSIKKFKTNHL